MPSFNSPFHSTTPQALRFFNPMSLQTSWRPTATERRFTSIVSPSRRFPVLRHPELSDHVPFLIPLTLYQTPFVQPHLVAWNHKAKEQNQQKLYAFAWNTMMQGKYNAQKKRYNNAFELEESNDKYCNRIRRVFKTTGEIVQKHPEIAFLNFAESPVPVICPLTGHRNNMFVECAQEAIERYIPPKFQFDMTSWGIFTALDTDRFPGQIRKQHTVYSGTMNDMNNRKTTLVVPGCQSLLTNLHVPHDEPETSLELLTHHIAHNLVNSFEQGHTHSSQVLIGDWNLSSKVVHQAITDKVFDLFDHDIPIRCHVAITPSPNGHIKANKSEVETDSGVVVQYYLAERYLQAAIDQIKQRPRPQEIGLAPSFA